MTKQSKEPQIEWRKLTKKNGTERIIPVILLKKKPKLKFEFAVRKWRH